jgi:heme-degrading monooxygenase HmoA
MVEIVGRVRIDDLDRYLAVFTTRGKDMRSRYGSLGARVLRDLDDDGRVVIVLRWESRERFEAFLDDPALRELRASSGGQAPEFTYVEEVADVAA